MALIKCSECGKEISDKAEICVNCGNPIQKEIKKEKLKNRKSFDELTKEEKKQLLDIMNSDGAYHNAFTIIITLFGILGIIGFFIGVFGGLILSNSFLSMFGIGCLISVVIISICSNTYNTSKLKQYYKENEDIEIMENEEETWKL